MSCCCEPESPRQKVLTALSGLSLLAGLAVSISVESSRAPLYTEVPDLSGILLLISAALGGANFIPSGLRSVRAFDLDVDLLMSAALIFAAIIGEFAEAAAIGCLFSLAELA